MIIELSRQDRERYFGSTGPLPADPPMAWDAGCGLRRIRLTDNQYRQRIAQQNKLGYQVTALLLEHKKPETLTAAGL